MAIKLIDVFNQLNGYSNTLHSNDKGQSLIIDSEVFSSDINIFRKNVLYLCKASTLNMTDKKKISKCNLIIIKNEEYHLKKLINNEVNIIECNSDINFHVLLKDLRNIFAKDYALLDSSAILLDALIKEKSITEIAQISSDLLQNPIIIIDLGFKILAHSDIDKITEHFWLDSIKRGYCSYEFIATVKQIKSFKESPNTNDPFIIICEQSPIRKLVSKIFINGNSIGYVLSLESEVNLKTSHYEIIKLLSNVLSQKLKKDPFYRTSDELIYENLIIDILEKNITDRKTFEERSNNLIVFDSLYLLSFEISKYNTSNMRSNYLRQYLDRILPMNKSVYFENHILILVNFKNDFYNQFINNTEFISFIEKQNITISVSSKSDNILDLPTLYEQCKNTLYIASKLDIKEHLYSYDKLKFYHMLYNLNPNIDILDFCCKNLITLIDYDKKHNTEYFKTLKTYLNANKNAVEASKNLYIHRNTINYRLNKIKEIANIDFDNMDELFMITMSMKILNYYDCVIADQNIALKNSVV